MVDKAVYNGPGKNGPRKKGSKYIRTNESNVLSSQHIYKLTLTALRCPCKARDYDGHTVCVF